MKPTTTQQTGKFWKLIILIGQLGLITAVPWIVVLAMSHKESGYQIPILITFMAFPTYLAGRIGKWWFHE